MNNDRQHRHSYVEDCTTVGFLTDSTLCIGCKACEVACKEWNDVPSTVETARDSGAVPGSGRDPSGGGSMEHSYDRTGALGADSWRHVKFVETETEEGLPRWLFLSDVCKHCDNAGCLNACPTGAIWRTEVGSVLVDDDRCNGCGYCVVSCPFGVIDRRGRPTTEVLESTAGFDGRSRSTVNGAGGEGGAFKCTLCYDRQSVGKIPACAHACPTDSILFGPLTELKAYSQQRIETLHQRGVTDAVVYDAAETNVGGTHALSILVGSEEPDVAALWGQPADPVLPSAYLLSVWASALCTVVILALCCWLSFTL